MARATASAQSSGSAAWSPAAAREVLVTRGVGHLDIGTGALADAFERSNLIEGLDTGAHTAALGLQDGVLADDGNLLHALRDREHTTLVLEEDDGFLGDLLGDFLALGLGSHLRVGDIGRDGLDGVADAEDLLDLLIDHLLGDFSLTISSVSLPTLMESMTGWPR